MSSEHSSEESTHPNAEGANPPHGKRNKVGFTTPQAKYLKQLRKRMMSCDTYADDDDWGGLLAMLENMIGDLSRETINVINYICCPGDGDPMSEEIHKQLGTVLEALYHPREILRTMVEVLATPEEERIKLFPRRTKVYESIYARKPPVFPAPSVSDEE